MPRHRVAKVVDRTDPADRRVIVRSATVYIYAEGTSTPVTVYSSKSGGTTLTQPLTTDLVGRICGPLGEDVFVAPATVDIHFTDPSDGMSDTIPYEAISAGDPGGVEAGFAQITTTFAAASVYPTITDVTGLVLPNPIVGDGAQPYTLIAYAPALRNSTSGARSIMSIMEGATELADVLADAPAVNKGSEQTVRKRIVPTAASHTYKVGLSCSAGAASIFAAPTIQEATLEVFRR